MQQPVKFDYGDALNYLSKIKVSLVVDWLLLPSVEMSDGLVGF